MNQIETNTGSTLVETIPLFASVWIALYYVLRRNLKEHRTAAAPDVNEK